MQTNFNPHLPPGYLETHSVEGTGWRSEQPVRAMLPEHAVAMVVRLFEREYQAEMDRQSREMKCQAVEKYYKTNGVDLMVIKHPWENVPTVMMDRTEEVR